MSAFPARLIESLDTPNEGQPVALVTGAGGGIGQAIVRRLHQAGMAVVLVGLGRDIMIELAHDCGCAGLVIEGDLSLPDTPRQIMEIVANEIGGVDYLVNNAGLNLPKNLLAIELEDWDIVLAVNLRAPMLLAKYAIPFWEKRGGGAIVNIGSRVWKSGSIPAYTASKAGVVGLTRSFAVELSSLNVRANVVAPGYVDTAFTRMDRPDEHIAQMQANVLGITPLRKLGKAEDVASAVAFLLSDEASYITGEVIHVAGGSQLASPPTRFGAQK